MALLAVKPMTLDGLTLRAGEVIPHAHWARQRERTRRCLTRTRLVRSTDMSPEVVPVVAPVRPRGRPRKES